MNVPLVPARSMADIDRRMTGFLQSYDGDLLKTPQPTPLDWIFENLHDLTGFHPVVENMVPGTLAKTSFLSKEIALDEVTYEALQRGDPRARFTTAHEIGHALLHHQHMAAVSTSARQVYFRKGDHPVYRDPEWQANHAAGCLLMPTPTLKQLLMKKTNVSTISDTFQASHWATRIRIEKLNR